MQGCRGRSPPAPPPPTQKPVKTPPQGGGGRGGPPPPAAPPGVGADAVARVRRDEVVQAAQGVALDSIYRLLGKEA